MNFGIFDRVFGGFRAKNGAPRAVSGPVFARNRPPAIKNLSIEDADKYQSAPIKPEILAKWDAGVRAADDDTDNVIEMFDVIGHDFWTGGGITAKSVSDRLKKMKGSAVEIRINSPGGDMFEGIGIYNVLAEHDGPVTVKIMGLAASAASIIAMAGDEVKMGLGSFIMIHQCWVMAIGNQDDMRAVAEYLKPFDDGLRDIYVERTEKSARKIEEWMKAEKFFSASEAIDKGFADSLLNDDEIKHDAQASASGREMNKVREAEALFCKSGKTRSQARALLADLKGKPGAAFPPPAKPDAGDSALIDAAKAFIARFK